MKKFFQQYHYALLKNASPDGDPTNFNPQEFRRRLVELSNERPDKIMSHDVDNVLITAETEYRLYHQQGEHIFVDEDTESVIINAISKLESKALAKFRPPEEIGIIYRAKKPPILYNYETKDQKSAATQIESLGIFRVDDLENVELSNKAVTDPNLANLRDSLRFVCGCFMMRECFPQVFQEGLPDYVKHPTWFKHQNNKSISIARVSHEVCPHIRVGHFRLLTSERFVNKRGQLVFVKPSMVKGHATHTETGEKQHALDIE